MKFLITILLFSAFGTASELENIVIEQDTTGLGSFKMDTGYIAPLPGNAGPGSGSKSSASNVRKLDILDIEGSGKFTLENPRVGDTLSYIITVQWVDPKVPVMVTAPDSLFFEGFKKLSVRTKTKKFADMVDGQSVLKSSSVFIYHLEARTPGTGKASSTEVPFHSALSEEKEFVPISTSLITIDKAQIPLHKQSAFRWVVIILLIAGGLAGIWFLLDYLKKRPKKITEPVVDIESQVLEIKNRITSAPSQELILKMEGIAVQHLQKKWKLTTSNFEELLNAHMENDGSQEENWKKLSQDFNFAKFGGGQKPSHEVQEIYKRFTLCIKE